MLCNKDVERTSNLGAVSSDKLAGPGALADYVKVRTVGRGSYGEAVLVSHKTTGQECVLKRIWMEASSESRGFAENAAHEAQVLKRLRHPNVVEFLGMFLDPHDTTGGTLCLLMAYCEGGDLQQRLAHLRGEGGRMREGLVLRWFDQLCSAVAYVHSRRVLHRDLKPSNIFIRRQGATQESKQEVEESVALGDFGVSRPLAHASEFVTTMVGTPCYLSPEVCRGKAYSYKSDIWALGCVLYEMVVLRPPFGAARNLEALVAQIVRADYEFPDGTSLEYPEAVRSARFMLRLDPDRRPTAEMLCRLRPQATVASTTSAAVVSVTGSRSVNVLIGATRGCSVEGTPSSKPTFDPVLRAVGGSRSHVPEVRNRNLSAAAIAAAAAREAVNAAISPRGLAHGRRGFRSEEVEQKSQPPDGRRQHQQSHRSPRPASSGPTRRGTRCPSQVKMPCTASCSPNAKAAPSGMSCCNTAACAEPLTPAVRNRTSSPNSPPSHEVLSLQIFRRLSAPDASVGGVAPNKNLPRPRSCSRTATETAAAETAGRPQRRRNHTPGDRRTSRSPLSQPQLSWIDAAPPSPRGMGSARAPTPVEPSPKDVAPRSAAFREWLRRQRSARQTRSESRETKTESHCFGFSVSEDSQYASEGAEPSAGALDGSESRDTASSLTSSAMSGGSGNGSGSGSGSRTPFPPWATPVQQRNCLSEQLKDLPKPCDDEEVLASQSASREDREVLRAGVPGVWEELSSRQPLKRSESADFEMRDDARSQEGSASYTPLAETARAVVCAADREERLLQRGRRSTDSSDRLCVPSMLNVDEVNAKSMLSPKAGPARGAVWRPPPSPVHVASPSERSTPFRTKVSEPEREHAICTTPTVRCRVRSPPVPGHVRPSSAGDHRCDAGDPSTQPDGDGTAGRNQSSECRGSRVSAGDRIEVIRACLEARMGTDRFHCLYRSLAADEATVRAWATGSASYVTEDLVAAAGGVDNVSELLPLVAKLVACEKSYFS